MKFLNSIFSIYKIVNYSQFIKVKSRKTIAQIFNKPTKHETTLINELRESVYQIPTIDTSTITGAELVWSGFSNTLRETILNDDPRSFLTWDVITQAMFNNTKPYIRQELKHLQKSPKFATQFTKALIETKIGSPSKYKYLKYSSGHLVHTAYHVNMFQKATHNDISNVDLIFEFGGGYGCMCRFINNIGFDKKYVLYDLPIVSALQKYYLKSCGFKVIDDINTFNNDTSGIICISKLNEIKLITDKLDPKARKLFIATWSLSETKISLREQIFEIINSFNLFLIGYKTESDRHDVNNLKYFNKLKTKIIATSWIDEEISHMPGHSYLFGHMNSI